MISGLGMSSSGIATAVRTASNARASMDDMSRQIATGQKVSSVKDNGAAWARAANLKSQKAGWEASQMLGEFQRARMQHKLSASETTEEPMREAMATLLLMTDAALPATTFARLRSEASASYADGAHGWQQNTWGLLEDQGAGDVSQMTLVMPDGSTQSSIGWLGSPAQWGTPTVVGPVITYTRGANALTWDSSTNQLVVNSASQAASAHAFLSEVMGYWRGEVANQAASLKRAEAHVTRAGQNIDRIDRAIGALTEADLGKVSTARAQADTRQQLAISTVRQAISAYGSYANGLLGNVSRTQRGVMA